MDYLRHIQKNLIRIRILLNATHLELAMSIGLSVPALVRLEVKKDKLEGAVALKLFETVCEFLEETNFTFQDHSDSDELVELLFRYKAFLTLKRNKRRVDKIMKLHYFEESTGNAKDDKDFLTEASSFIEQELKSCLSVDSEDFDVYKFSDDIKMRTLYDIKSNGKLMKVCRKCKKEFEATTVFFYQDLKNCDGLTWRCKSCISKRVRLGRESE